MFGRRSQNEPSPQEKAGAASPPGRDSLYRAPEPPDAGLPPRMPEPRGTESRSPGRTEADANAKRLFVGRDVVLSGEIDHCETMITEGRVEAVLKEGGKLEIAETGVFKGTATVDRADVAGRLEGTITVREHLAIRSTGRVEGTIRYGAVQIAQGGVLAGTAETLPPRPAPQTPPSAPPPAPEPKTEAKTEPSGTSATEGDETKSS